MSYSCLWLQRLPLCALANFTMLFAGGMEEDNWRGLRIYVLQWRDAVFVQLLSSW